MKRTLVRLCGLVFLTFCFGRETAFAQVLITEIMYQPASQNTNHEWVEIYNPSSVPIDLLGWKFTKGISFTFTNARSLAPRSYLVIAAHPAAFRTNYPSVTEVVGPWSGTLRNSGEKIQLDDANGNQVTEVTYANEGDWGIRRRDTVFPPGWDWFAEHAGLGKSLELVNLLLPPTLGQNWSASAVAGGTPGAANSVASGETAPVISDLTHFPAVPRSTNLITITAHVADEAPATTEVLLFYRNHTTTAPPAFSNTRMFDDGLHNDGAANDGVYGAILPPQPNNAIIEFYVQATDGEGLVRTSPAPSQDGAQGVNALLQVDDSVYTGNQPMVRLIMTATDNSVFQGISRQSDAQMNATMITTDNDTKIRYNVGMRIRGAGSRTRNPPNYRVNIPNDRPWNGVEAINLNTQYTHAQLVGGVLAKRSGLAVEDARAIQVRVNGANLANSGSPQFSSYVLQEAFNGDWAANHFPEDSGGNVYRASTGSHNADLNFTTVSQALGKGYTKTSNSSENDWSDLLALSAVLRTNSTDADFVTAFNQVANAKQWMTYFAVFTLMCSMETSIANGQGDDYGMYRGVLDPRFIIVGHDFDTIFNEGDTGGQITASIFRMITTGVVPLLNRFMTHREFVPLYYGELKRLGETTFSAAELNPLLDRLLSDFVPPITIANMKSWAAQRVAYCLSQVPTNLTVTSPLGVVSGYPRATSSTTTLNGRAHAVDTRSVYVNGVAATWDAYNVTWSIGGVGLSPGINRVLVESRDSNNVTFAQNTIDIWYDDASISSVSGTITGSNNVWTAANGPYSVSGTLSIANGATLTIEPGTTVYLNSGANINVAAGGTLIATGTPTAQIRFTRQPGGTANWGGITVNGNASSPETRIAYAHFEFNGSTAIHANAGTLFLDHLTFGNTAVQYVSLDGSSFVVQNCVFPSATAQFELVHGTQGIKAGGRGIFQRNFVGKAVGYNDPVDFTGGNRPGPIIQFLNNVFLGSDDDILDLDSTDAWIEGNIFLHAHKNGSPDSSSAISGGADNADTSQITAIGNIFYDCDNIANAKQGNFYTIINNTIVRQTRLGGTDTNGAVALLSDIGTVEGAGMYLEGNIIYDAEKLVFGRTAAIVTYTNNLIANLQGAVWAGPGGNNTTNPPSFNYIPSLAETTNFTTWAQAQVMRDWFSLRPGSPEAGTGPNGRDKGGLIPLGASVSDEPIGATALNTATLTVGVNRTGNGIPTAGWPDGSGYTHYRYRLDNGAWSTEQPIDTPITLTGLANGSHHVDVIGKRDSGFYQDDSIFGPDAVITSSRTWTVTANFSRVIINEVLAQNTSAFLDGEKYPDVIELYNSGSVAADLSGMGLSDERDTPYKFTFPAGTTLAPGAYLVLIADTTKTSPLHTGFNLNQEGDEVYLFARANAGGALIDSVQFGQQLPNLSIGRDIDGVWTLSQPTLGSANIGAPRGNPYRVKVNEWLAVSEGRADFVELYNPDSLPVDIGGFHLTDQPIGSPGLHTFRPLTFILANGYLTFAADGNNSPGHLSFSLSSDLGMIVFTDPGLAWVDFISYQPQRTEISEGRRPNGSANIASFAQPTPGAGNPTPVVGVTVTTNQVALMPMNKTWRYDQANDYSDVNWTATDFNDAGWASGAALLGFENDAGVPFSITTPLNIGRTTYYFRTTFVATNDLSNFTITASIYLDDGAVVYINGTELTRIRMPGGAVSYSTLATPTVDNANLESFTFAGSNLRVGTNYVAVEAHQSSSSSSDLVWGMQLDGLRLTTNITASSVAINEVMANNRTYTNTDGTVTDWIELYNPGGLPFDAAGFGLSDATTLPPRWIFPAGATVPPGGRLVVRFDPNSPASTTNAPILNTGFGFDSGGDEVVLFDRTGSAFDSVRFGIQAADFTIGRIPDGTGNWTLNLPTAASANIGATLGNASSLRVNEWMANPKAGDDDYFEIYNPLPQPVALGGLQLTDDLSPAGRTKYTIPALSFIGTGIRGYARFLADNNPQNGADHVNFKLDGDGESVGLFTPGGITQIDAISFGPQLSGVSQGRLPDGSTNIVSFARTPTPGQANYLLLQFVVINEVLTHTDDPLEDAVEIYNLGFEPVDISGWWLSDSQADPKRYRIPSGTILPPFGFAVFYEYQFNPDFGLPPSFSFSSVNGDEVFLSAADAQGNLTGFRATASFGPQENGVSFGRFETSIGQDFVAMSSRSFGSDNPTALAQFRTGLGATNPYPKVGPIVINEIHYHPPDIGTNDNSQDEFIELRNISANPAPLFDPNFPTNIWQLRDAVQFDFAPNTAIPANGYLLVVNFDPTTNATTLAQYRTKYGIPATVPVVGPFNGKLSNDDDEIELRKPDAPNLNEVPYVIVERIHYRDSGPWPSAADGNTNGVGISLQRLVGVNYGNDPVNWIAGVPTPGLPTGLAISNPPAITVQPLGRTVLLSNSVTFTVTASGAAPLRYQWRFNADDIVNATNASLTVANVQFSNAGKYSVRVVNTAGTAISTNAVLVLQAPPEITAQPQNKFQATGSTISFNVGARGTQPLSYQWQKNGVSIPGATLAALVLNNAQSTDQGNYRVIITNAFGSVTSVVATLQVADPVQITSQPQSQIVLAGQTVTFNVTAGGGAPLGYQWRFNGANIAGATSPQLVLTNVQPSRAGIYSVLVTNPVGSLISPSATLTVIIPPTVSIVATDPVASEANSADTGQFTISRSGTNSLPLTLSFTISGTAQNGIDYETISSPITLPVGVNSATITVTGRNDPTLEPTETVVLTLNPSAEYVIGQGSATVRIIDDDNKLPSVTLTSPTNGAFFPFSPTNLALSATASDPESGPVTVQFFYDATNQIGQVAAPPYQLTWTNPPTGSIVLTAVASDQFGASATSAPVVFVLNGPPLVSITSPTNNGFAPVGSVLITASATDANGSVAQVDFYLGSTLLGSDNVAPYSVVFPNAPLGNYQVRAVASDSLGLSATSAVVNFTVIPANTNFADAFANRGIIGGFTESQSGNNSSAGIEANEPNHYFTHALRTVWAVWTAPISGSVTVDTVGSSFDTILAVYTNAPETSPGLATLRPLVVNDDLSGSSVQSRLQFNAIAQTSYFIAIAGYDGASGLYQFHLAIPNPLATIDTQPLSQTNNVGTTANFFVSASGAGPLTYQWRFNGANISGATGSSFSIDNVQGENDGNYDVIVSNPSGSVTSAVARLVVRSTPAIVTQPRDQMVPVGADAAFTVVATGGALSYQWRFNGTSIPGATSATYVRANVQPAHAGTYTVLIANSLGSVLSQPATLTIGSPLTLGVPRFASGVFSAEVSGGAANSVYVIEVSTNLTSWSTLTTVSNASGSATFTDANTSGHRVRAYRARLGP